MMDNRAKWIIAALAAAFVFGLPIAAWWAGNRPSPRSKSKIIYPQRRPSSAPTKQAAPERPGAYVEPFRGTAAPSKRGSSPARREDFSPAFRATAEQAVRSLGWWCPPGSFYSMIRDDWKSTQNRRIYRLSCDDGQGHASYRLTTDHESNILSIVEW